MSYWDLQWLELVKDKVLKKISVSDDQTMLTLHTDHGDLEFDAEGDCCSSSWIEHFDSPKEPEKIINFKQIEIPPSFESKPTVHDHYEEEMAYYFYEVITEKASYLIEMRNSSNGYYGGYLEFKRTVNHD